MLTYQLHTRIFRLTNGVPFVFPNQATLEVKFAPLNAFGVDSGPGKTVVKGHKTDITINVNTGTWQGQSNPPLKPLSLLLNTPNHVFSLQGNNLRIDFLCEGDSELSGTLMAIKWILPTLLNLGFAEPPIVTEVAGSLGESKFRWELKPAEWNVVLWPKKEELLEDCFANSITRMPIFQGTQNRRLAAALRYFYVGTRLAVSGESSWEFMAETILNFAKTLEILFATSKNTKEDVRRELKKIGYTTEEIEEEFVPIMELRRIDVAHPKIALYEQSDLRILYQYMHHSENTIRKLLNRVVEMLIDGAYQIPQDDLSLGSEDRRHIRKLVEIMNKRVAKTYHP